MGKHKQLTGFEPSLEPTEKEVQAEVTSTVLPFDLNKHLQNTNTSNILSFDCDTTILLNFLELEYSISFNLTENVIIPDASSFVPAINLTEQDTQEINSSEVLSFELRDYDQASLEFKIVLEFFNESGGVF